MMIKSPPAMIRDRRTLRTSSGRGSLLLTRWSFADGRAKDPRKGLQAEEKRKFMRTVVSIVQGERL